MPATHQPHSAQADPALRPLPAAARSVCFISLGCPKNLVDSETMLGELSRAGFRLVPDSEPADAIIINTCGFLEASKQESLDVISEAIARKQGGEIGRVIVAGCLVQRHRAKLLQWAPGIDAMIGVFDRDRIIDAVSPAGPDASRGVPAADVAAHNPDVSAALPRYWITSNALQAARDRGRKTVDLTVNGADGRGVGYFEDDSTRVRLTPRHWAYLRVSEGCNQRCAFCTIPSIRGKMRSKPMEKIISEVRALLADGAFEINLIGQDTTSYGYDIYGRAGVAAPPRRAPRGTSPEHPGDLIGLLTALDDLAAAHGSAWLRLMYVYPTHFTDAMIDAIASLPNIVKYIDIPLQHISDRMLSTMRRNITRAQQEELLRRLRERIPGLAIRTTFITGFPGETEADHEQLLDFIDGFGFDHLGVFRYSREDSTPAGTMDRDPALHVPDDVKARREQEIMLLQQEIAFDNAKYLGEQRCEFDVLVEREAPQSPPHEPSPSRDGAGDGAELRTFLGRCYHQAPQVDSVTIIRSAEPLAPGELVRCTIVDADGYDLIAHPTAELQRVIGLPLAQ